MYIRTLKLIQFSLSMFIIPFLLTQKMMKQMSLPHLRTAGPAAVPGGSRGASGKHLTGHVLIYLRRKLIWNETQICQGFT